jgi:hypothetical protein
MVLVQQSGEPEVAGVGNRTFAPEPSPPRQPGENPTVCYHGAALVRCHQDSHRPFCLALTHFDFTGGDSMYLYSSTRRSVPSR